MSTTTLIPDSGFNYANLIDSSDSTFVQTNGASTERLYNLSDTPVDLVTVTAVNVNLRMSQKEDGTIDDFKSAQIFKSDGSTAITSIMEASGLTGTIADYDLVPVTLSYTDKTSWDGALLKLIKNALAEGGPDQGIRYYEASVDLTYTPTDPPTPNSGTVGVENTPELYLYVDGIYSLAAATGQVGSSIGNMTSISTAYSNNDLYGFVNNYQLDGIGFITDNQLTILGSTSGNLDNLTATSIIGNSSTNFGASYGGSLGELGLTSSGYFNFPLAGHVLTSLSDMSTINTSGGDYGSSGISGRFKYTSEQQRFIGRACNVVKLESNINKLTTSCFSMLKSNPVTIYPTNKNHTVCKCDCTINIPIYLNRAHTEDVELVFRTNQGVGSITYDGDVYIPAVTGQDFYSASGVVTIGSGEMYGNFPVDIINNTGNPDNTYFNISLLRNPTDNVCISSYNFNVFVKDCTNECLYRWTYTPTLDWELIADVCSSGSGIPPYTDGDYIGEERYGTCVI